MSGLKTHPTSTYTANVNGTSATKSGGAPVVRAIDNGFGATKYTTASASEGFGCDLFRSISPRQVNSIQDEDGLVKAANRMIITVGESNYVIGKDAHLAMPPSATQALDEKYASSDSFIALTRGALAQMNLSDIDLVMMGLAMNTWKTLKGDLRERFIGKHKVPNLDFPRDNITREVLVRDVRVIPQPLGGFYNYCFTNPNTERLSEGLTLVVDAGYGTLDFIVLADEVPVDTRSGGVFGSVGKIVRAVAEKHRQGLSEYFTILNRIDDSLRTSQPANIEGRPVNFAELYAPVVAQVVDESMTALRAQVGSLVDIDHVLLTGGGAHFFIDALRKLARRDVLVDQNPVFSNVRGFQCAGEQFMQRAVAR